MPNKTKLGLGWQEILKGGEARPRTTDTEHTPGTGGTHPPTVSATPPPLGPQTQCTPQAQGGTHPPSLPHQLHGAHRHSAHPGCRGAPTHPQSLPHHLHGAHRHSPAPGSVHPLLLQAPLGAEQVLQGAERPWRIFSKPGSEASKHSGSLFLQLTRL